MSDFILSWQLLKKEEIANSFSFKPIGGGCVTLTDLNTPLKDNPLLKIAIDITNLNIKETLNEYPSRTK